ncbi:MAG: chemotaxis protein CheW [Treponema sp.]|jgi:purine-binding chemotaxis protein CheW|nr:chemotaxis protein CheW [Treponema sp.]
MTEFGDQDGVETGIPRDNGTERYLVCTVLEESYALPSRFIGEIALFDKVYPLPLLPDYVLGIINRYSVPYALLDTGVLIAGRSGLGAKVLVLKEPDPEGVPDFEQMDKVAFLVDDVVDIVEIERSLVLPVEGEEEAGGLIESSFSWKGNNVLVLDIRGILARALRETAA